MPTGGTLYTISAPSGAGKTSLVKALLERDPRVQVSVSHTTRPRRQGEIDDVDYHFVKSSQFMGMLEDNAFLEYAQVFDNYYGTSKYWVEETIKQGKDVILEIDWQGARQVRQLLPETHGIFILPPSRAALEKRLEGRGQDDTKVIAQRMQAAISEMCHYVDAQWLIVNDNFEQALAELMAILQVQRLRCERQRVKYAGLLNDLLF